MHPWLAWSAVALGALLGALAGLVAAASAVGALMPRSHVVSRSQSLKAGPAAVWAALSDRPAEPSWRPDLKSVERLPDRDGHPAWREVHEGNQAITLVDGEAEPPRRQVRHIADDGGPFSGRWEFALDPAGPGSRVTITEHGTVPNPFFRFVSARLVGHATYLDLYLSALAARFGEPAAIE